MTTIRTTDGQSVQITSNSTGHHWRTRDAGVPLDQFTPAESDPLTLWRSQPSLRKVVSFAARQIASVSWHAYERVSDTDRQRRADSPAERTLGRTSRFISGYRFWELLTTDVMIYDRYVAILAADGELVRIPPRKVRFTSDYFGRPSGIELLTPAGQDNVDLTQFPLMVGWGWAPSHAGGVSPLQTLADILDEHKRSVDWRRQQWKQSPKFNGIIKHPSSFKDESKKARFMESVRSWRDADAGTPLFENGMEYETIDPLPASKDQENIAGRQLTDAEVASAYHIPPELVGARAGNFSNIAAFRQMLFGPTLGPQFKDFKQAINAEIIPGLDTTNGVYVEPNIQEAISGSFMEQAQVLQTMTGGPVMTRAEARARLNLPYIAGTEELVVPMNVTEGGLASPTDTGRQNRRNALPATPARKALEQGTVRKAEDPGDLGEAEDHRAQLTAALTAVYEQQRRQVLADGGIEAAQAFHDQWDAEVAQALKGPITAAALAAAWQVLRDHNPDADGWDPAVMDAYLEEVAATTAEKVNNGVVSAVEDAGQADEDDERDDEERLNSAFAVLISVGAVAFGSVIAECAGFGGQDAAEASGVSEKTWIVTSANPRESHAVMHGETVRTRDRFSNGAKWPGDATTLDVDDLAGCTCAVEWTVP